MSIHIVKQQVGRFLQSDKPEVLALRGAWGVGKTYSWNQYLQEANKEKRIALEHYSYVSLFGVNSMGDLRLAIFENMVNVASIGTKRFSGTLEENTKKVTNALT